jgi:hypothetical protein
MHLMKKLKKIFNNEDMQEILMVNNKTQREILLFNIYNEKSQNADDEQLCHGVLIYKN